MSRPHRRIPAGAVLPLGLLGSPAPAQDAKPKPFRMSAVAINMSGVGRPGAESLQIVIERWSTDEERTALINTLVEQGTDKLLSAVQKIKPRAGYIRTNTSLGWDIQFARMTEIEGGGKRIVFATDRPMNFYEVRNSTRSSDYEFMLCEIHLGPNGEGQGKLAVSAKVTWDKDKKQVEIENYGQEPVRLTKVTVDK